MTYDTELEFFKSVKNKYLKNEEKLKNKPRELRGRIYSTLKIIEIIAALVDNEDKFLEGRVNNSIVAAIVVAARS